MKSLLLATAAVAALAVPAFAQEPVVGSIGISYSDSEFNAAGIGAKSDAFGIDGVVAFQTGGNFTVTVGAVGAEADDDTAVSGVVHLSTLTSSDVRFGGFIGASDAGDETALNGGLEVQKYLGKATLTGVVAYTTVDDLDVDAWSVGADAAFYPTESLRVNLGLGYVSAEALGIDVDGLTYGVGVEHDIANTPFSVAASYSSTDIDDFDLTFDTLTIGLRYSFGGGLQARDRAGASLPGTGVASILGAF